MKFKKKYVVPDLPTGTTRIKRVFAWLPTHIDDTTVWMENFEILQAFMTFDYTVIIDGEKKKVSVSNWIDISRRIMT